MVFLSFSGAVLSLRGFPRSRPKILQKKNVNEGITKIRNKIGIFLVPLYSAFDFSMKPALIPARRAWSAFEESFHKDNTADATIFPQSVLLYPVVAQLSIP